MAPLMLSSGPRQAEKLTKINEVSAGGPGTCHVSVDHTGKCAFVANYGGGSAASFSVDEAGKLSEAVSFFQYEGHGPKPQQTGPRGHRVTVSPDNRYLFVNDLGLDEIHVYHLDSATAKLTAQDPPAWKAVPGSGPRALRFHPNGRWVYCLNEVGSSVNVLDWDAKKGVLTTAQLISTVPEGHTAPSAPSEIVIDKTGRFVYAANRFDNFLVSFSVFSCGWKADADGEDIVRRKYAQAYCTRSDGEVAAGSESGDGQSFCLRARCQDRQGLQRRKKLPAFPSTMHFVFVGR